VGVEGGCAFRCDRTTRRTIWDGDQVLAEIRYPTGQGEQDTGLDSLNLADKAVRDARQAAGNPNSGPNTSDWAQSGRVLYIHGGGMDQPLGLVRMDYSYDFAAPFAVVPHASWRGVYEDAAVVGVSCHTATLPNTEVVQWDSTGHAMAPALGPNGEYSVSQERCVEIDFPGKFQGMTRLLRRQTVAGPITWMGSLMQDAQDASGLMFRRNRYYDAASGRFTQEDPIGLAGGVNSYGFANGDPVNHSDPYGLCPIPITDCPPGYFTKRLTIGGAAAGAAAGAGVGLVVAAPTGELASPLTVGALGLQGATNGAIAGFVVGTVTDAGIAIANHAHGGLSWLDKFRIRLKIVIGNVLTEGGIQEEQQKLREREEQHEVDRRTRRRRPGGDGGDGGNGGNGGSGG
jgi:RHS repeat-associated protein